MEVVAVFEDSYSRDYILMRGPMLSEYRDAKMKPTAGIRLDIPNHLMGVFKTLESFGFALRRKHGGQLKKHIKLDEFSETLYIQVGIKKDDDSQTDWTDYTAEEAKNGLKQLNAKKAPRFDFLASPSPEAISSQKPATRKGPTQGKGSGFPWIPPARVEKRRSQSEQDMEEEST